ncbi:uridine kinase [Entomoplasma freundtii]|uniref:Uridine kinase n=1 Tax=Entomoplasma freundtii TaxID=74700 RepID=A0A2K8NR41_9MOLU|nr:uridine kinase [Entomoplasma freundtii]ATZ16310.1 uridine kinase [Entomoplasma freundtii]TDY56788.1 uridine kinase [Entomoplasma freundtii]
MTEKKPVFFIIIAGGTASGKSTVARKIAHDLKNKPVTHLSMDNYYKNFADLSFAERQKINYDHPHSLDIDLLSKHLTQLKNRESIDVPVYDFKTHSRSKETKKVEPADVVILDGLLALHIKEIRDMADLKVFIKTEDDVRFIRRLERDIYDRGRSTESVIAQYLNTVKPMHDAFVAPSMDLADIIVPYYEGNDRAVDLVTTKVKAIIRKNNK